MLILFPTLARRHKWYRNSASNSRLARRGIKRNALDTRHPARWRYL